MGKHRRDLSRRSAWRLQHSLPIGSEYLQIRVLVIVDVDNLGSVSVKSFTIYEMVCLKDILRCERIRKTSKGPSDPQEQM